MHGSPLLHAGSVLLLLGLGACASDPPLASGALIWSTVAEEQVPVLVTRNPDASLRETKLWLVVLSGEGFIRTGDSRWFQNIQRDPRVRLRIGGASHRMTAQRVDDPARKQQIAAAFREKYGFWDRLVDPMRPDEPNFMSLIPR